MEEERTYSLVGFPHGLLVLSEAGGHSYHYKKPDDLTTLLRILHMPESLIQEFRAACALGIVVSETHVHLTADMLKWLDAR